MANIVVSQKQGAPATMKTKYRDMGDSTHALVTACYVMNELTSIISGAVDGSGLTATKAGNGI